MKKIIQSLVLICLVLNINSSYAIAEKYTKQDLIKLIETAEVEQQIPKGLLAAVAEIESGFKPYVLNINARAVSAKSITEAKEKVEEHLKSGYRNIDIGVMQLNWRWHGRQFNSIADMLRPENNINYAAKLLKSLYKQHGTWHKAVRYYHSANSQHHKKYSRKVVLAWISR